MAAKVFPLSDEQVAEIEKGDVFGTRELVRLLEEQPGTDAFRIGLVEFTCELRARLDRIGKVWAIRQDHDTIKVLTDEEALDFFPELFGKRWGQLHDTKLRMSSIDTTRFTDNQRRQYERALRAINNKLTGLHPPRADVPNLAYQQTTPIRSMLPRTGTD